MRPQALRGGLSYNDCSGCFCGEKLKPEKEKHCFRQAADALARGSAVSKLEKLFTGSGCPRLLLTRRHLETLLAEEERASFNFLGSVAMHLLPTGASASRNSAMSADELRAVT